MTPPPDAALPIVRISRSVPCLLLPPGHRTRGVVPLGASQDADFFDCRVMRTLRVPLLPRSGVGTASLITAFLCVYLLVRSSVSRRRLEENPTPRRRTSDRACFGRSFCVCPPRAAAPVAWRLLVLLVQCCTAVVWCNVQPMFGVLVQLRSSDPAWNVFVRISVSRRSDQRKTPRLPPHFQSGFTSVGPIPCISRCLGRSPSTVLLVATSRRHCCVSRPIESSRGVHPDEFCFGSRPFLPPLHASIEPPCPPPDRNVFVDQASRCLLAWCARRSAVDVAARAITFRRGCCAWSRCRFLSAADLAHRARAFRRARFFSAFTALSANRLDRPSGWAFQR